MATFFGSMMAGCCSFTSKKGTGSLETGATVGEVFCLGDVVLRVGLGRALLAVILEDFEPWTPPPLATAPGEEVFLLLRAFVGFAAFLGGVVLWWVEPWGVVLCGEVEGGFWYVCLSGGRLFAM